MQDEDGLWVRYRRTPRGVRGLKSTLDTGLATSTVPSHPSRGAWIEILLIRILRYLPASHPSRGAWIEILGITGVAVITVSRTPRGVRGLKLEAGEELPAGRMSHPSRGAWIEIVVCFE